MSDQKALDDREGSDLVTGGHSENSCCVMFGL